MRAQTKEKVLSGTKTILMILGLLGFIAVAAVAGNMVQLLKYTPLIKKSKLKVYEINRNIKRLMEQGLLRINEDKNYKYLEVTEKGKKLLLKLELEGLSKKATPKWDKKYRVIIFDIPEEGRRIRDELRRIIEGFGFVCLQKSVWIYPYPCQDVIELLRKYLGINGGVIYMTVDSVEDDQWLKDLFSLK